MKEFFGFGKYVNGEYSYVRDASGAWSVQHLAFVGCLIAVMIALAVWLGVRARGLSDRRKNRTLIVCAFLINGLEILKIVVLCIRCQNPMHWLYVLPLFLCSLQLIAIPLAAFGKGLLRDAALDFVMIFGILGAIFGTIGAAQNYATYPVLSMDNVFSGVTHCISGFASLYIAISGMASMKRHNFWITNLILLDISVVAYIVNLLVDYNYMFLMNHDGTPYSIVYNMVNGHPVLYPILVVVLFVLYTTLYYAVYYFIQKKRAQRKTV